ncbi:MAG: cyclic pyranopterin monophosphate synthase [Gaiellaceae bacterium]|nr:cyclic pyranopterin monophosphate synthase [Gaiellaceae bacterium]
MSELSHVDESGAVKMVDVGAKPAQRRRAVARAVVRTAPETAARLRDLPKGDALTTAQLAGIMAAKRTSELIPLCHPLALTHIEVDTRVLDDGVEIIASAETTAQTGVEMEALTAASVAALTVYDMAKAIDKGMTFSVELLEKVKE